jgi:hypothetical protein
VSRYSFSGHESFQCKSLWLKKGLDFLHENHSFTDPDAVAKLGVGKNMVSSIRFWLKSFGLSENDRPTAIADYLFSTDHGKDPYTEDTTTLWILHFLIVTSEIASIYALLFVDFQREKKEFTKAEFHAYIKRKCTDPEQKNVYNENTVKKDIGVLLKNYVAPSDLKSIEDFSALLLPLGLLVNKGHDTYAFKETRQATIHPIVIYFALLRLKGKDMTISFDTLQKISLVFCLPMLSLIEILKGLEKQFPGTLVFSDNSGIKNVQFLEEVHETDVLNTYYNAL